MNSEAYINRFLRNTRHLASNAPVEIVIPNKSGVYIWKSELSTLVVGLLGGNIDDESAETIKHFTRDDSTEAGVVEQLEDILRHTDHLPGSTTIVMGVLGVDGYRECITVDALRNALTFISDLIPER